MSEALKPYRKEGSDIVYRSKWDDIGELVKTVKTGVGVVARGVGGTIAEILKWTLIALTTPVWAPILMFWVHGYKKDGGKIWLSSYDEYIAMERHALELEENRGKICLPIVLYEDNANIIGGMALLLDIALLTVFLAL